MPTSVGIDLGTTFSAVAYVNPDTGRPEVLMNSDGKKTTPSVIHFVNGRATFGSSAEAAYNTGASNCAGTFKREMGASANKPYCYVDGKAYTPVDLQALLLRHLKEEAERELGDTITDAVITVPAYFFTLERENTKRAAEQAGLNVIKMIDEPNAACMAYGLGHWRENANIMVYDLGGGTFDVTIVNMGADGVLRPISTHGDHLLGGRDWDAALVEIMMRKLSDDFGIDASEGTDTWVALTGIAEDTKKKLSSMMSVTVNLPVPSYGEVSVIVTREEFEQETHWFIDKTGAFCDTVLRDAGMTWSDIDDILLVGGSTRMPRVSSYLQEKFGKRPISHVNPDEAVALGAAIQATMPAEDYVPLSVKVVKGRKEVDRSGMMLRKGAAKPARRLENAYVMKMTETTAHSMGAIAVSEDWTHYITDFLIPAHHPRPVKAAKEFRFVTSGDGNDEMEIFVTQGESDRPLDNQIPFRYVVTGITHDPSTGGETRIRVQYSYDSNGIVHVEARQGNSNVNLPIRREPVPDDMSKFAREPEQPKTVSKGGPLYVIMAIDVSGSMSGDPMRDAQNAVKEFVDRLDMSNTQVCVLAVSDRCAPVVEFTSNVRKIKRAVDGMTECMTGICNGGHPFDDISSRMAKVQGRKFGLVLADGIWENQSYVVTRAHKCNSEGVETAAVGFGSADKRFLNDISSSEANAMFVAGSSQLVAAFGSIAQALGGQAAISGPKGTQSGSSDVATW